MTQLAPEAPCSPQMTQETADAALMAGEAAAEEERRLREEREAEAQKVPEFVPCA